MSGEPLSLDCDERNIFPVGQSSIFGENEFTACASLTNPFSVELRGDTTYSSNGQVCVFPVNVQAGNVATLYPAQTGSGQTARHNPRPGANIAAGVTDHGGFAGGATGGMDAHHLVGRYGEHAERIILAQVC